MEHNLPFMLYQSRRPGNFLRIGTHIMSRGCLNSVLDLVIAPELIDLCIFKCSGGQGLVSTVCEINGQSLLQELPRLMVDRLRQTQVAIFACLTERKAS